MPDRRLGVYQATKAFPELTTTRLYIAFAKGQISAVRQGQRLYFLPADLERFRVSLVVKQAADAQNAELMARRAKDAARRAKARASIEAAAAIARAKNLS